MSEVLRDFPEVNQIIDAYLIIVFESSDNQLQIPVINSDGVLDDHEA